MKKRFFSIVLAALLIISLLPTAALAKNETPFTDVSASSTFYDGIRYVYEEGLMNGTTTTTFNPTGTVTRGMIVAILWRLDGMPLATGKSFSDVAAEKYYATAVSWASANGIVDGYGDGKFGPDDPITRQQMAAILYRYATYCKFDTSARAKLDKFTDQGTISSYAVDALAWANAVGLINGVTSTTLDPKGFATRQQAAAILMRFCKEVVYAETTFVVTFDLNYAKGGIYTTQEVAEGEKAAKPKKDPTRSGYVFDGWYTKESGGRRFDFNKAITEDITLYAHWTLEVVVPPTPPTPEHTHTYSTSWSHNATYHWHAATCGHNVVSDKAAHTWNSGATTKAATCTEDGVKTYTCTVCGATKTETVPATGHDWTNPAHTACSKCQNPAVKFELAVTSDATVSMKVYDDYSFVIKVPNENVSATSVSATVTMSDVAGLGVNGTRSANFNLNTGIPGNPALRSHLCNAWAFGTESANKSTMNVTIGAKPVSYTITGSAGKSALDPINEDAYIYGKPNSPAAARAAWQELVKHVETGTNASEDSYVSIAGESSLALGEKKLVMSDSTKDLELFKGTWSTEALEADIREAVELGTYNGSHDAKAVVGEGTVLALSSSMATLKDTCTITMDGLADTANVLNALPKLQNAEGMKNILKALVEEVNNAMGDIQGKTLTVNVTFN